MTPEKIEAAKSELAKQEDEFFFMDSKTKTINTPNLLDYLIYLWGHILDFHLLLPTTEVVDIIERGCNRLKKGKSLGSRSIKGLLTREAAILKKKKVKKEIINILTVLERFAPIDSIPVPNLDTEIKEISHLYKTDQIYEGLEKARSVYEKIDQYPHAKLLRYMFKFYMRLGQRSAVQEMATAIIDNPAKNEALAECYLALVDCDLRDMQNLPFSITEKRVKLNNVEINLNKLSQLLSKEGSFPKDVLIERYNYNYHYNLGRMHIQKAIDNWESVSKFSELGWALDALIKALIKASEVNTKANKMAIKTWWIEFYVCVLLNWIGRSSDFDTQKRRFTDAIKNEYETDKRASVRSYRISSFLLNENKDGLEEFLNKNIKMDQISDFLGTPLYHSQLIFMDKEDKAKEYKEIIEKWLAQHIVPNIVSKIPLPTQPTS